MNVKSSRDVEINQFNFMQNESHVEQIKEMAIKEFVEKLQENIQGDINFYVEERDKYGIDETYWHYCQGKQVALNLVLLMMDRLLKTDRLLKKGE